jgi:NDP-sugar pyrophosphorylase family protein
MDAIIMAAGLGTRLRPHTLRTPKPLLPVQGRPILDWALGSLPRGVDRVLVVINYLAEQIEAYLQTQTHFAEWETVRQEVPRGTGDAVRSCKDRLRSDSVLVLNGDDLYGAADLARLAACSAGVLCHPVEDSRKFGTAVLKPDGTLQKLVEKIQTGPGLANTGAYVFPRTVFDRELILSPRGEYEVTDYVSMLAKEMTVEVVRATFWLPIGNVDIWHAAQTQDLRAVSAKQ